MNCEKYLELISDYLDTNVIDVELKEHLESCALCREELESMQKMVRELNDLPAVSLPDGFHERTMANLYNEARIQQTTRRIPVVRKKIDYKKYTSVAAAVVVCFVLFGSVLSFANNVVTNRGAYTTNEWGVIQDLSLTAPMAAPAVAPMMAEAEIAPVQRAAPS